MPSRTWRSLPAAVAITLAAAVAAPTASATPASVTAPAATTVVTAKPDYPTADVHTGPSKWRGRKLRHPDGGRFPSAVQRWANLAAAVMREHRVGARWLPGVLAQIQQESSGNPRAVNRWDSNARAGHPSKGLLQIIAPTYRAYAKPGYRSLRYQMVPYTNLWAAMNYVIDRYGKRKFKLWTRGHNQGY